MFLGRSVAKTKHMSDETARIIDQEVKALIEHNYQRARQLLVDNMDIMHAMKDALMKYETIDAPQVDDLMARREVRPPAGWLDEQANRRAQASNRWYIRSRSHRPRIATPRVAMMIGITTAKSDYAIVNGDPGLPGVLRSNIPTVFFYTGAINAA